jgi:hypothetical protein
MADINHITSNPPAQKPLGWSHHPSRELAVSRSVLFSVTTNHAAASMSSGG